MGERIRSGEEGPALGDLLARGYSRMFVEHFIVPMGAAIWSAPPGRVLTMPVLFFARFFANHRFLDSSGQPLWRVVAGGSREYVAPLVAPFRDRIRLSTPVTAVRRFPDRVEVTAAGGEPERFDHAVIAVHSDQALRMLADSSDAEREILSALPYQENRVVLHTDTAFLPARKAAWAAWNYLVPERPSDRVAVTYDMNILQGLPAPVEFLVTLNRTEGIRASAVHDETVLHHPVFTGEGIAARDDAAKSAESTAPGIAERIGGTASTRTASAAGST